MPTSPETRVQELHLTLPPAPKPVAVYKTAVRHGNLDLHLAGHKQLATFAYNDGKGHFTGVDGKFGRTDLNSPQNVLERLGYTDTLLLAMILRPGQRTEPWAVAKYDGLRTDGVSLPGESFSTNVNFNAVISIA